jgi:hypothetical protein
MKSGGYFVNTEIPLINQKAAVDVMKTRPCFDPSTGSGSARTGWKGHLLGENPFALRAASGAAVEGDGNPLSLSFPTPLLSGTF